MQKTVPKGKTVMHALNQDVTVAVSRMQIVYLVNLFEPFMEDYIISEDSLDESKTSKKRYWREYLKREVSQWDEIAKKNKYNNSSSFMNIRYSLFVLEQKYGIEFPSYFNNCIPELGSLRNCLVHHNGCLEKMDKGGNPIKESLKNTIRFLGLDDKESHIADLRKNGFVDRVIDDMQNFIDLCGGFIRKPIEHKKWLTNR